MTSNANNPVTDTSEATKDALDASIAEPTPKFVVIDPTPASIDHSLWGTHGGITCDGCGCKPIQGYRYKCKNCKNHDICESCFENFKNGKFAQDPSLARINPISKRQEDHEFSLLAESDGSFSSMLGAAESKPTQPKVTKKIKPNEPCPCNSGKKYKKCCRT